MNRKHQIVVNCLLWLCTFAKWPLVSRTSATLSWKERLIMNDHRYVICKTTGFKIQTLLQSVCMVCLLWHESHSLPGTYWCWRKLRNLFLWLQWLGICLWWCSVVQWWGLGPTNRSLLTADPQYSGSDLTTPAGKRNLFQKLLWNGQYLTLYTSKKVIWQLTTLPVLNYNKRQLCALLGPK